jgi:hypothetical protein
MLAPVGARPKLRPAPLWVAEGHCGQQPRMGRPASRGPWKAARRPSSQTARCSPRRGPHRTYTRALKRARIARRRCLGGKVPSAAAWALPRYTRCWSCVQHCSRCATASLQSGWAARTAGSALGIAGTCARAPRSAQAHIVHAQRQQLPRMRKRERGHTARE